MLTGYETDSLLWRLNYCQEFNSDSVLEKSYYNTYFNPGSDLDTYYRSNKLSSGFILARSEYGSCFGLDWFNVLCRLTNILLFARCSGLERFLL
jgi:hypothetical protein